MLVIPAIDIRNGRCVRLVQGDTRRELVYADDPAAVAGRWVAQGARYLHVVDLDGAYAGRPIHLDLLRLIVSEAGVPVPTGGGFAMFVDVEGGLAAAAAGEIVGERAL